MSVRTYEAADRDAPVLVLAHGAGAGQEHSWMIRVAQGLADRGVTMVTFDFPYKVAGKNVPDKAPVLEDAFVAVWCEAREAAERDGRHPRAWFAGGKSMGGRISSHVAAQDRFVPPAAGLIFFGYPLHPPGKPEQRRDKHLPGISVPMLFLHGTKDPFGTPDEMRPLADGLKRARLELVEGGDHSLQRSKAGDKTGEKFNAVLDLAAGFVKEHT